MDALLCGTARRDISNYNRSVHDPLFVRVCAMKNGKTALIVIQMDTVSIGGGYDVEDSFLPELRARLAARWQIPAESVVVGASHTHTAGRMLCDHQSQLDRTEDAVGEALRKMEPVYAGYGAVLMTDFAMMRSLKLKNGKRWTVRQTNPCPADMEIAGVDEIDERLGVLRFDRCSDGSTLAVIFNFGCHPLDGVPDGAISAQYPGFAAEYIEHSLDSEAMALFLQGTGGDVIERDFKSVGIRSAENNGIRLGRQVVECLRKIKADKTELRLCRRDITFPLRSDLDERIAEQMRRREELLDSLRYCSLNFRNFLPLYLQHRLNQPFPGGYPYEYMLSGHGNLEANDRRNQGDLDKYLANIAAMEKLAHITDTIATYRFHQEIVRRKQGFSNEEITAFLVGGAAVVTSSAEMCSGIGLKLKAASPFENTMIAAYANGYSHYGVLPELYGSGCYESIECNLAPEWEQIALKNSLELLRCLKDA